MGLSYEKSQNSTKDYRDKTKFDEPCIYLITVVIKEIEEDIQFRMITYILEKQVDEVWKKMYLEDIALLDRIKSKVPKNITIYTNIPNHLEINHGWRHEIKFGQWYYLKILRM